MKATGMTAEQNPDRPQLNWRFTCERHQQLFISALECAGVGTAAEMETIRRHFSAWLAEQYPHTFIHHMNAERCIGCDLEAAHINLWAMLPKILELAQFHQAR
jgi:hypothetical protein